jgi:CDP-diacylglycerol--serine O-phosphatidyltransferase
MALHPGYFNSFSGIGKDLDSLADMVSFGFLPSVILYELFLKAPQINHISDFLNFIAFLLPVFSAFRLAKFNNDTRQAEILYRFAYTG